jgi:D-hexose-6-phosphate mutarotase
VAKSLGFACRPYAFKAVYTVTLHGEKLQTQFTVHNTGGEPFDFTAALHTYIEVLDIKKANVRGLKGLEFLDKVRLACHPLGCRSKLVQTQGKIHWGIMSSPSGFWPPREVFKS